MAQGSDGESRMGVVVGYSTGRNNCSLDRLMSTDRAKFRGG